MSYLATKNSATGSGIVIQIDERQSTSSTQNAKDENRIKFLTPQRASIELGLEFAYLTGLKQVATTSDIIDIPNRQNWATVSILDKIVGIVTQIEGSFATIEFEKDGSIFQRKIDVQTIKRRGINQVRPGDGIAFISYEIGRGVVTELAYLGKATVKLDSDTLSDLDSLYNFTK